MDRINKLDSIEMLNYLAPRHWVNYCISILLSFISPVSLNLEELVRAMKNFEKLK